MRPFLIAAPLAALWLVPAAHAEDKAPCGKDMVCASDPQSVLKAMEKAGLKPKLEVDGIGEPMISSEESTYNFSVYFYGCEEKKNCDSLQFQVMFEKDKGIDLKLANKWNLTHRFLQAALRDDGTLVLGYDIGTIGGLNQTQFKDTIDWWTASLDELSNFFEKELPKPKDAKKAS